MSTLPPLLGGRRRRLMGLLLANGLAQSAASVYFVLILHDMVDHAGQGAPSPVQGGLLAALALAIGALRLRAQRDAEDLGQDYVHRVRLRLFKHLCTHSPRTHQRRSQGGTLLRFIGDLSALRQWISLGLARLCLASVTTLGTLFALTWLSPRLALLVTLVLGAGALATVALGKPLQQAVLESRRQRSRLASQVAEKTTALAVIQAHGQERRERKVIGRYSQRLHVAMVARAAALGRVRASTEITALLAIAAAVLLGSHGVAHGLMGTGEIVAAMAVIGMLMPAIRDLGRVYEYWRRASVSIDKLEGFLQSPRELRDAPGAPPLKFSRGDISLHCVSIPGVMEETSTFIPGGSLVVLLGANGSGKSTLLGLVARQLKPATGSVLIDGQDISGVTLESLRQQVSLLGPDLPLMRGSVRRNLCYRDPSASDQAQALALRRAGARQLVDELPRGLETRLGSGGAGLSVGQRQRLALARGLLGEPGVLLLDEMDANLDEASREMLLDMLPGYPGTVILATHDASLAALADLTLTLHNGKLEMHSAQVRHGETLAIAARG